MPGRRASGKWRLAWIRRPNGRPGHRDDPGAAAGRQRLSGPLQGIRSASPAGYVACMTDSIRRLYDGVRAARGQDPSLSRTARLLRAGPRKIAKKVAEEATEV